jgi:hypothetical protein
VVAAILGGRLLVIAVFIAYYWSPFAARLNGSSVA